MGLRILCALVTCARVSCDLLLLFLPTEFWGAPCLRVSLCTPGVYRCWEDLCGGMDIPISPRPLCEVAGWVVYEMHTV